MSKLFYCEICMKEFKSRSGRNKHKKTHSYHEQYTCFYDCGRKYLKKERKIQHERTCELNPAIRIGYGVHQQHYTATTNGEMKEMQTAHNGNYKLYRKEVQIKSHFKERLEEIIADDVIKVVRNQQRNNKFYIAITVIFQKTLHKEIFTDPPIYFTTTPTPTTNASTLMNILDEMGKHLYKKIEAYTQNGSGWRLYEIRNVDVQVSTIHNFLHHSYT